MNKQTKCSCGADHLGHLCMLRSNGMYDTIATVTSEPRYYCFICGGEANCAENLCEPAKIE